MGWGHGSYHALSHAVPPASPGFQSPSGSTGHPHITAPPSLEPPQLAASHGRLGTRAGRRAGRRARLARAGRPGSCRASCQRERGRRSLPRAVCSGSVPRGAGTTSNLAEPGRCLQEGTGALPVPLGAGHLRSHPRHLAAVGAAGVRCPPGDDGTVRVPPCPAPSLPALLWLSVPSLLLQVECLPASRMGWAGSRRGTLGPPPGHGWGAQAPAPSWAALTAPGLWCAGAAGHSRGARSCGWDGAGPRRLGLWCGQRGLPRPPTWFPPAAAGDPALRVTLTLLPAGTECGQSVCSSLSIRGEPEKPLGSPGPGPNPTTARTRAAPRQRIAAGPSPRAALRPLLVGAGMAWHGSCRGAGAGGSVGTGGWLGAELCATGQRG